MGLTQVPFELISERQAKQKKTTLDTKSEVVLVIPFYFTAKSDLPRV